jgi:hypothetical protein
LDLDYWHKFEDEVPDTVKFTQEHGVELIHCDEDNRPGLREAAPRPPDRW